jgi:hypothetical protein
MLWMRRRLPWLQGDAYQPKKLDSSQRLLLQTIAVSCCLLNILAFHRTRGFILEHLLCVCIMRCNIVVSRCSCCICKSKCYNVTRMCCR